jgi:hypothetical protein
MLLVFLCDQVLLSKGADMQHVNSQLRMCNFVKQSLTKQWCSLFFYVIRHCCAEGADTQHSRGSGLCPWLPPRRDWPRGEHCKGTHTCTHTHTHTCKYICTRAKTNTQGQIRVDKKMRTHNAHIHRHRHTRTQGHTRADTHKAQIYKHLHARTFKANTHSHTKAHACSPQHYTLYAQAETYTNNCMHVHVHIPIPKEACCPYTCNPVSCVCMEQTTLQHLICAISCTGVPTQWCVGTRGCLPRRVCAALCTQAGPQHTPVWLLRAGA